MEEDTVSFPAVISQRTPLLCHGKDPLLQCGEKGLPGSLGCPAGFRSGSGKSLSLCLKYRTQVPPCFSLKGLHYHPSSHWRCAFLHQYQQQPSKFYAVLEFFFVGMWTLLQCSVFCIMVFLLFFLLICLKIFFVCLSDQHILEEDHGGFMESKPVKRFLSKSFSDITILISTFHRLLRLLLASIAIAQRLEEDISE